MSSTRFSGHETFNCKHFWLKKGYDFVQSNREFKDADAASPPLSSNETDVDVEFDVKNESDNDEQFVHVSSSSSM